MGTVNIAILASTNPKIANKIHTQLSASPPHKVEKRGLFSSIGHALKIAVQSATEDADNAASKVKDAVKTGVQKIKEGGQKGMDGIDNADQCACVALSQWCYFLTNI
jgi:hypothetical protein